MLLFGACALRISLSEIYCLSNEDKTLKIDTVAAKEFSIKVWQILQYWVFFRKQESSCIQIILRDLILSRKTI